MPIGPRNSYALPMLDSRRAFRPFLVDDFEKGKIKLCYAPNQYYLAGTVPVVNGIPEYNESQYLDWLTKYGEAYNDPNNENIYNFNFFPPEFNYETDDHEDGKTKRYIIPHNWPKEYHPLILPKVVIIEFNINTIVGAPGFGGRLTSEQIADKQLMDVNLIRGIYQYFDKPDTTIYLNKGLQNSQPLFSFNSIVDIISPDIGRNSWTVPSWPNYYTSSGTNSLTLQQIIQHDIYCLSDLLIITIGAPTNEFHPLASNIIPTEQQQKNFNNIFRNRFLGPVRLVSFFYNGPREGYYVDTFSQIPPYPLISTYDGYPDAIVSFNKSTAFYGFEVPDQELNWNDPDGSITILADLIERHFDEKKL